MTDEIITGLHALKHEAEQSKEGAALISPDTINSIIKALHGVEYMHIPAGVGLDPIYVYFTDFELGKGMMTVACYGQAWSCGFGAMGERGIKEFIRKSGADYVANKMECSDIRKKSYRDYTMKIATRIVETLQLSQQPEHTT